MLLSVIIVNYNSLPFTLHCLHTVRSAKEYLLARKNISTEILLVDNASPKDDINEVSKYFSDIDIIRNQENLGFGKANNLALKKARGNWVLFLNPDTLIQENSFVFCVDQFLKNEKLGALGVRMVDGENKFLPESKRNYPSLWASFCKLSKLYKIFSGIKLFDQYYASQISENANGKVSVLSGAFLMARKTVLEKIGGFDERYFMYGEDIDLSVQVEKAGYENWYFGEHTILHYKGESTDKDAAYIERFYGAMELFNEKYHPYQAKLIGGLIRGMIRYKSKKQSENTEVQKLKLTPEQFNFIVDNDLELPIDLGENEMLVWQFKSSNSLDNYLKFLSFNKNNRKGIYIKPYPFVIEIVSSVQRGGVYEWKAVTI